MLLCESGCVQSGLLAGNPSVIFSFTGTEKAFKENHYLRRNRRVKNHNQVSQLGNDTFRLDYIQRHNLSGAITDSFGHQLIVSNSLAREKILIQSHF